MKLFEKIFPPFFFAALSARDRLLEQLQKRDQRTLLVFSSEPILDLLDLSGYAIIYSELDGKKFWDFAQKLWESYFSKLPDSRTVSNSITSIVQYRESLFGISPRDLIRTSWKQDFEERLRERNLLGQEMFSHIRLRGRDTKELHPSPLIRSLAYGWTVYTDPYTIFLVQYLSKRPEAAGVTDRARLCQA